MSATRSVHRGHVDIKDDGRKIHLQEQQQGLSGCLRADEVIFR